MSEGFLSRWARRKHEIAQASPGPGAAAPPTDAGRALLDTQARAPIAHKVVGEMPGVRAEAQSSRADADGQAPLPLIEDLTPSSDFSAFMHSSVAQSLRAQALRKLFADPHFNTMDGLDTYIDDYGAADPLPTAWLEKLNHARGLVFDAQPADASECAPGAAVEIGTETPGSPAAQVPGLASVTADERRVPEKDLPAPEGH